MHFFNSFLDRSSRFFTLVELLVVISIVSVLSSVGFSGLQTARTKAADGGIKETLSSARNEAGIYYSNTGSYGSQATTTGFSIGSSGVFSDPKIVEVITAAEKLSGGQVSYVADGSSYSLSIPLKSDSTKSWCVDSTGNAGIIDGTILTTSCASSSSTMRSGSGGGGSSPSSCAASGGCALTADGGTCTSYTVATVDSPAPCSSVEVQSTCNNGVWSTAPGSKTTCTVTSSCIAPDGSQVAHNGTWTGYPTSWVACGSTCPARTAVMTCNNGSWVGSAAPSCSVAPCNSCTASGGCGTTAHNGTCTTYQISHVGLPTTCASVTRTSICSNGSWNTAPYMSTICMVHDWSTGAWGACSNGNQTRSVVCKTNSGTGSTVSDAYCTPFTKPSTSQSCSTCSVSVVNSNAHYGSSQSTNLCSNYGYSDGCTGNATCSALSDAGNAYTCCYANFGGVDVTTATCTQTCN